MVQSKNYSWKFNESIDGIQKKGIWSNKFIIFGAL